MAEALITGLFDGFSCKPEELPSLRLEIPAKADQTEEIRAGLALFRQHAGASGCEFPSSEDEDGGLSPVRTE
jgi:hypothetical protein